MSATPARQELVLGVMQRIQRAPTTLDGVENRKGCGAFSSHLTEATGRLTPACKTGLLRAATP